MFEDLDWNDQESLREVDPVEIRAREHLRAVFNRQPHRVYFSRQLEVQNEGHYFHWITNRAIRNLEEEGVILSERRNLTNGGTVKLVWHKAYRYYRREAASLVELINEYADPNIGAALGLQGEALILDGFASIEFVMRGRDSQRYQGRVWTESDHDLDFLFERDGRAYGVEVKNTLGYMDREEFDIKLRLAQILGVRPVFAARMLPKSWINDLIVAGGFALIFKYQLYPWSHRELAKRVRTILDLPVDAPRRLGSGTMERFRKWHEGL